MSGRRHRHLPRRQAGLWIAPGQAPRRPASTSSTSASRQRTSRSSPAIGLIRAGRARRDPAARRRLDQVHRRQRAGRRRLTRSDRRAGARRDGRRPCRGRLRDRRGARLGRRDDRRQAARGDDRRAARRRRRRASGAAARGWRSSAPPAPARSCSGRASVGCRRRRSSRATSPPTPTVPLVLDADGLNAHAEEGGLEQLARRGAPTVLTPHAGRARPAARMCRAPRSTRTGFEQCARRARALRRDRRAQGRRHAGRRARMAASRSAPAARRRSRRPGPVTSCAGVDRRVPGQGRGPVHRRLRGRLDRTCAAGVIAAERDRRSEGVIASDVIAALPRAREPRSGAAPRRSAEMALRAVAEVNLAAIERNAAAAAASASGIADAAVRGGQGRRLRARRRARPRAPPCAAARRSLAVATAAGGRRAAASRPRCADPRARRGQRGGAAGGASRLVPSWSSGISASSSSCGASAPGERADPRARQARHRPRPARHARRRTQALAVAERSLAAAPALELAGAMTHFATADGDLEFVADAAGGVQPVRRRGACARRRRC